MKRIEGSFVPSLNNVNLCNTTQIVLFRFFKDSQQSIQFKYFNTVKNKTNKKRTKTRKTIVLCIKHRYRADKRFTLCVLVHVHKIYRTTHLNYWGRQSLPPHTPHPHPHSLRLGGWWERPFPYFFKHPPPYPHPTAWLEEQSGTLLPMAHKIIRVPSPGFT